MAMGNKRIISKVFLTSFILPLLLKACASEMRGLRARLLSDLLEGYDHDARPAKNESYPAEPTVVSLLMTYNQLQHLDEPTQVATSLVWISTQWKDDYLKWNTSKYGGIKRVHVSSSRIWTPDLTLYNNANKDGAAILELSYEAEIHNDGNVTMGCPIILKSVCPIEIGSFPFDTQKCKLKIGSWRYNGLDIDLRLHESTKGINLKNLEANSVWELKSVTTVRNSVKYACCPEPFYDLTYTFEFRRKPLYYIMTIIYPSILLSLLFSISFLFPADSGERVSLVTSVLLGLVVFMIIVNEHTPVSSEDSTILTIFFNSISSSTVLALIATAFILHLNHASPSESVPRYLANMRDCIASALFVKRRKSLRKPVENNFEDMFVNESQCLVNTGDFTGTTLSRKQHNEGRIIRELRQVKEHLEDEKMADDVKEEWHYTMRVFDRLFFVIFFLMCVGFITCIFLIA